MKYPILADPDQKAAKAMGVLSSAGFSKRWTFYVGKDGKLLAIEKKVDVRGAGKQVVEKLAELGIPKKKDAAKKDAAEKTTPEKTTPEKTTP